LFSVFLLKAIKVSVDLLICGYFFFLGGGRWICVSLFFFYLCDLTRICSICRILFKKKIEILKHLECIRIFYKKKKKLGLSF
jgi:hypothetical protein